MSFCRIFNELAVYARCQGGASGSSQQAQAAAVIEPASNCRACLWFLAVARRMGAR